MSTDLPHSGHAPALARFFREVSSGIVQKYEEEFGGFALYAAPLEALFLDYTLHAFSLAGIEEGVNEADADRYVDRIAAMAGREGHSPETSYRRFRLADPAEMMMNEMIGIIGDVGTDSSMAILLKTSGYTDQLRDAMKKVWAERVAMGAPDRSALLGGMFTLVAVVMAASGAVCWLLEYHTLAEILGGLGLLQFLLAGHYFRRAGRASLSRR